MDCMIKTVQEGEFPHLLKEIPQPPVQLFYRGNLPEESLKLLSVVGSRKYYLR